MVSFTIACRCPLDWIDYNKKVGMKNVTTHAGNVFKKFRKYTYVHHLTLASASGNISLLVSTREAWLRILDERIQA